MRAPPTSPPAPAEAETSVRIENTIGARHLPRPAQWRDGGRDRLRGNRNRRRHRVTSDGAGYRNNTIPLRFDLDRSALSLGGSVCCICIIYMLRTRSVLFWEAIMRVVAMVGCAPLLVHLDFLAFQALRGNRRAGESHRHIPVIGWICLANPRHGGGPEATQAPWTVTLGC